MDKPRVTVTTCKSLKGGIHRVVGHTFGCADTVLFESNTKSRVDVVADYLRDNQEVAQAAIRACQTRRD